ncbi:transposase [Streptomyces sp. ISL-44]|nr:transposase [Streptomyces sp. ISL-44]
MGEIRWGARFWSPAYFAASCGGAPLSITKEYVENQRRPE